MINIPELRGIINDLLTRVEREVGPTLALDANFYWDLPSPEKRDMSAKILEVDLVGGLVDDLDFLRAMENPLEIGPTSYLVNAAALLQYIGEKVAV